MNEWKDQSLKVIVGQVAEVAHAGPSIDLLNSLGPSLSEALAQVMRLETDPSQAAKQASERLANPESR